MATALDDCFVVFVRDEGSPEFGGAAGERELVACSTYAEAEWVRRENGGIGGTGNRQNPHTVFQIHFHKYLFFVS